MHRIGAIVLAAGGSSRLGRAKQLLHLQGESLVRRVVRAATDAGCEPVVVVGKDANSIRTELSETLVMVVDNPNWERGLGTSIRCGVCYFLGGSSEIDGVVILTCDQPFVNSDLLVSLIKEWKKTGKPIAACSYAGTVGVPALFDRSCFVSLLALPDDCGAKGFIESRDRDVALVSFEQAAVDVDLPVDLERLRLSG